MTMSTQTGVRSPGHFDPRGRTLSKWVPLAALAVLTALGWIYLGVMIAGHMDHPTGGLETLGPGMGWLDGLMPSGRLDATASAFVDALCRPSFGHGPMAATAGEIVVAVLMWVAMVLAMMLPTAAPMVMAAADVAHAAARRGEGAAAPLAVLAGYLAVWVAFALVAALMQVALTHLALLDTAMATASPLFAGAVFIAAGAYQFSALKDACVANCRRPVPFFAAERGGSDGGFRLGLRQGRFCIGCCWAMMLVMFAVGTMNVVWMAGFGFVMALEKIAGTRHMSRAFGVVMLLAGAVMMVAAIVGHWPSGAGIRTSKWHSPPATSRPASPVPEFLYVNNPRVAFGAALIQ